MHVSPINAVSRTRHPETTLKTQKQESGTQELKNADDLESLGG